MLIVKDVEKSLENKKIIDGLSFYVRPGECAGLIGANGAGKTTLVRMLTGSLLPDEGIIRVKGLVPYFRQKELIPHIGMVSASLSQLWKDLPLKYSFENCQGMYGIKKADYEERLEQLNDCLGIKAFWEQEVGRLSLGQRMLGEMANVLLRNPSILFLDEPTIGLALDVKEKVLKHLKKLQQQGITILYTSHDMRDVEYLCNHLILLEKGRKLYDGSLTQLWAEYDLGDCMELVLESGKFPDMEDLPIRQMKYEENRLTIHYQKSVIPNALILEHIRKQCQVLAITTRQPALEEIIRFIAEK